jgi:membrane-bound hydrogenase subunit alpha
MESSGAYNLSIGPIHPALKEPIYFEFKVEGEYVLDVDIKPGVNHRGIEYMGMKRNPVQVVPLAERICGICSVVHPYSYVQAIERSAGIIPTEKGDYLRTIMAEIERVHSHLLWAGVGAHELGFDTLLHLTWRVRENVMDLHEAMSGNRVNYSWYTIGGVHRDVTADLAGKAVESLEYYEGIFKRVKDLFFDDPTIRRRAMDIGPLSYDDAVALNVCGPTTRAAGVRKDVRATQPYSAYADFGADVGIEPVLPSDHGYKNNGDVFANIVVRVMEIPQSIAIIRYCLENLPDDGHTSEPKITALLNKLKKADGEGIGRHEAPRGEVFHYTRLKEGDPTVDCWKVRAPTYNNLMSWVVRLKGHQIADIPIIIASIDPCIGCMDRVTLVDNDSGKKRQVSMAELHKMSVRKTRRLMK